MKKLSKSTNMFIVAGNVSPENDKMSQKLKYIMLFFGYFVIIKVIGTR